MTKIKLQEKDIAVEGNSVKLVFKELTQTELKATSASEGIMTFYASVFGNVDSYGDIMQRGAFAKAIERWKMDGKYPKVVWNHDWMEPLGKAIGMEEDEFGLKMTVEFNMEVQRAREVWALYKQGALTDFSFGYSVTADDYDNEGHRLIKDVRLYEVSPVLIGANDATHVTSMKTDPAGDAATPADTGEAPAGTTSDDTTPPLPQAAEVTTPPTENTPKEGSDGEGEGTEVKAGAVLSKKNRELVTNALTMLKTMTETIATAGETIKALEALLDATESPEPETATGGSEVDKHGKSELKLVLRNAQRSVKATNAVIVTLKKLSY